MTLVLILVTAGISLMALNNRVIFEKYKFNPYKVSRNGEHIRWISHGFLHGDFNHLLFNMFTLYFFGPYAEQIFGSLYVPFYILAIVVASIPDYYKQKDNPYYSSIGASGAVSAVLFSLLLYSPWEIILVFFIPMYFILYAVFFVGYSYYMSKRNSDNIGHIAHLTGALFGVVATIAFKPESLNIFLTQLSRPPFLN